MAINHSDWLEDEGTVVNTPSAKETIVKYLSYWPLFLISLLVCIAAGLIYLSVTAPKYNISESILIKNRLTSPTTNANTAGGDLLSIALDGGSSMNIDNEVQLLHSVSLMERIVAKNRLNIVYYQTSTFSKTDVYPQQPFILVQKDSAADSKTLHLALDGITKDNVKITVTADELKDVSLDVKWNQLFQVNGHSFILSRGATPLDETAKYQIDWKPVGKAADEIAGNLSVNIPDKKTTIIKLALLSENVTKGQDILNWVVKEYNQSSIEEKNTLAQNTIHFIDDRLGIVTNELSGVEGNLEGFQGKSRLVNIDVQASQQLENTNDISKNINDILIQQRVVDILQNYFNDPSTKNKLVPSNLGINDATLISLITQYNDLQSKRQREAPQLVANSMLLQDLDNQIADVKTNISENLANISKNLKLQETGRRQKDQEYQGFISDLPRKQRMLQDIKRKQTITEGLYLYLLQKREETAISFSTSNASTYKQIDPPKADDKPAEPNRTLVKLGALFFGLLIPFGWIKLRETFYNKIITKNELTSASTAPVVGEISHIAKMGDNELVVAQQGAAAEEFRTLRTNIALQKADNKVILVTSHDNNEGKSMISRNLAAILATPGKKVALLEFDLRDPNGASSSKGLTDFLSGGTNDVNALYTKLPNTAGLHIFSPGTVTANPGDLLLSDNAAALFAQLKNTYDYIVIDTAAAGQVSDAFILGKYSDITLYIVRLRVSAKNDIDALNSIAANEKLKNLNVVVNGVKN